MDKAIIYYTCNSHLPEIDGLCRERLGRVELPVVSVSLNKTLDFGTTRLVMEGAKGPLMMHKQILAGLRASSADFVFLCESDVLYSLTHFDFAPSRFDVIYYNVNVWKVRWTDKLAVWTDDLQQVSGICASRELLLDFYARRVEQIARGFDRHYEPRGYPVINWQSAEPNLCIRHDDNLTRSKWEPTEFRNPKYAAGWKTSTEIWGQYGVGN
jgi:hypothetical protein